MAGSTPFMSGVEPTIFFVLDPRLLSVYLEYFSVIVSPKTNLTGFFIACNFGNFITALKQ